MASPGRILPGRFRSPEAGIPLLLSGMQRKIGILISMIFGTSIAFYRLGTGAHFLSDTILAGLLSVITALFCYIIIVNNVQANYTSFIFLF